MPKRGKNVMSDGELSALFLDIGRAKEAAAQEIMQTRKQEEEKRRKALREKFGFLSTGDDAIPDSLDIDATERRIEEEINLVREGKLHKYNKDEEKPSDEDKQPGDLKATASELDSNTDNKPDIELLLEAPEISEAVDVVQEKNKSFETETTISESDGTSGSIVGNEEVNEDANALSDADVISTISAETEPPLDLDIELDDIEEENSSVTVYFTSGYNAGRKKGAYAYDVYCGTSLVESVSKIVDSNAVETPIFAGATEMLQAVKATQMYSALLFMTENEEELLRKNAIFGMTGNYGGVAAEYIKCVKELSEECYLTVAPSTTSKQMDVVKQRVETLLNQ